MRNALVVASLVLAFSSATAATDDCAADRAELEALRAKVKLLEAGQLRADTAAPTPAAAAPAPLPGAAAKPAAVARVVIEEPYSKTGCRKNVFTSLTPAAWQDAELWLDLDIGMSAAEVEKLLGVEHYDEAGGNRVVWHYGKCGASSRAQVLFDHGKLTDWRAPKN